LAVNLYISVSCTVDIKKFFLLEIMSVTVRLLISAYI